MAGSSLAEQGAIAPVPHWWRRDVTARGQSAALGQSNEILRLVESRVASWHYSAAVLQSRHWHRLRYPQPVAITPMDEQTGERIGETRVAVGRDISLGGLSFEHRSLLPYRRIAATLMLDGVALQSLLLDLTWCRFIRRGTYQSGGKFLRTIELLVPENVDWESLPRA